MRTIKFRGKRHYDGKWVYGCPLIVDTEKYKSANIVTLNEVYPDTLAKLTTSVEFNTLGQFTGLYDKNGKEIYEGDIVEFYEMQSYCINPDCEPHIRGYGSRIYKYVRAVRFEDCSFGVDNEFIFTTLSCCGFLKDNEVMDEMKNDPYFDANGYDIDSIDGIEVIGNIHDNPDLIEKGGEE